MEEFFSNEVLKKTVEIEYLMKRILPKIEWVANMIDKASSKVIDPVSRTATPDFKKRVSNIYDEMQQVKVVRSLAFFEASKIVNECPENFPTLLDAGKPAIHKILEAIDGLASFDRYGFEIKEIHLLVLLNQD